MNAFDTWCAQAVSQIRYKPDRQSVSDELKAHLEDHYDALIAQGCSPAEAERRALKAMGSPEDIAPQLGQIHRPWLGYLYSITKWITIPIAAFALFLLISFGINHANALISIENYLALQEEGQGGFYSQPNVSVSFEGHRFKVAEAAINAQGDTLYLEFQSTTLPWIEEGGMIFHIWAVDSLGNYYASSSEGQYVDIPEVAIGGSMSSGVLEVFNIRLTHFDGSAEWVELHYDRDGRDIVLRIDLTGVCK